jgi:tetratricopeptide (TPR) repeat protein
LPLKSAARPADILIEFHHLNEGSFEHDADIRLRKMEAESKDPAYWFQKGALCATYGNNQAAVRYFGRAIALDPGRSAPFFSQGVSYGQLGQYEKAFTAINRAIEMEPRNGLYFYGRARTYLLAGDRQRALEDFRTAAQLGDEDAQAYLRGQR